MSAFPAAAPAREDLAILIFETAALTVPASEGDLRRSFFLKNLINKKNPRKMNRETGQARLVAGLFLWRRPSVTRFLPFGRLFQGVWATF